MSYDDVVDILDMTDHDLELEVMRLEESDALATDLKWTGTNRVNYVNGVDSYVASKSEEISQKTQVTTAADELDDSMVGYPKAFFMLEPEVEPPAAAEAPDPPSNEVVDEHGPETLPPEPAHPKDPPTTGEENSRRETPSSFETCDMELNEVRSGSSPAPHDVVSTTEMEVTPTGHLQRTSVREVTSDGAKVEEIVQETSSEQRGDTQITSSRLEQFEQQVRGGPVFKLGSSAVPISGLAGPRPFVSTNDYSATAITSETTGVGGVHFADLQSKNYYNTTPTGFKPYNPDSSTARDSSGFPSASPSPFGRQSRSDYDTSSSPALQMFQVSKVSNASSKTRTWSPSGQFAREERSTKTSESYVSSKSEMIQTTLNSSSASEPARPSTPTAPPPVPPPMPTSAPKQRPYSMPPLDLNILEAIEAHHTTLQKEKTQKTSAPKNVRKTKDGHTINPSDEDSRRFQMLMKAFQPADDEGDSTPTRTRKMFSSSSFYDEPQHIYPTVEEQVELCKKIATSLSAETNVRSKGASMYIKRKKRSYKWVTEGPDPTSSESEVGLSDAPITPEVRLDLNRPRLKLVLDPRQLQDAVKLSKTGMYNEHNVVSPDICFDLVRDLNSPTGRGAQLFAKRKKKSSEWIVDEKSVKDARDKKGGQPLADVDSDKIYDHFPSATQYAPPVVPVYTPAPPPENRLMNQIQDLNPRVKLVKSPWDAALASPIGSCDAAFEMIDRKPPAIGVSPLVADSVMRAAERRDQPWDQQPPPLPTSQHLQAPGSGGTAAPQPPPRHRQFTSPQPRSTSPYAPPTADVYKPRAPKGWSGFSGDQSSQEQQLDSWDAIYSSTEPSTAVHAGSEQSLRRFALDQFGDYNNRARAWTGAQQRPGGGFRPVRPSSFILTK